MAYATVSSSSSNNSKATGPLSNTNPNNVITIQQEVDFIIRYIFSGERDNFLKVNNTYIKIYEEFDYNNIPLTSVVYVPNKKFFEQSLFYKQANTSKILTWLRRQNILVFMYGITASLDYSLDNGGSGIGVGGGGKTLLDIDAPQACIPTIFKNEYNITNDRDDVINILRFENSPFNARLNAIRERRANVYPSNYDTINCILFNELNDENCIKLFMKKTINTCLTPK